MKGDLPTVDRDDDKNPVVALREIAAETVDLGILGEALIKKLQRVSMREEQETRDDAAITAEVDLSEMVGDYSDDEGEASGMQITSAEEMEPSGFEDVDLTECRVKIRQSLSMTFRLLVVADWKWVIRLATK